MRIVRFPIKLATELASMASTPHVALHASQISPAWDRSADERSASRIANLREVLSNVLDPDANVKCHAALDDNHTHVAPITNTHRRLSVSEADALPASVRQRAIAIRGAPEVAVPVDHVANPTTVRMVAKDLRVDVVRRAGSLAVDVVVRTPDGARTTTSKTMAEAHRPLLDALFVPPPTPLHPKPLPTDIDNKSLSPWLMQRLAHVLQDGFRLHALVCAAADAPRPLVIDNAYIDEVRDGRVDRQGLVVVAKLHPSSAACVCAAHGLKPATANSYVSVVISVCGLPLGAEHEQCTTHTKQQRNSCPEFENACLHRLSVRLVCSHAEHRPILMKIPIPETSHAPLRAVMSAAIGLFKRQFETAGVDAVIRTIDALFVEFETVTAAEAAAMERHDAEGVNVLKRGRAFHGRRGDGLCVCAAPGVRLTTRERALTKTPHVAFFKKKSRGCPR